MGILKLTPKYDCLYSFISPIIFWVAFWVASPYHFENHFKIPNYSQHC